MEFVRFTRRFVTPIIVLIAAGTLAAAGEVYGKVTEGGSPVGEGVSLEARCGDKTYPAVRTDKSGSYRMVLAETGKCSMTVTWKQQTASLEVASYDDAVQLDLVLQIKDGKLSVRRK